MAFLPVTYGEMIERGWERPDFVYVCGDAYVDHPSFGAAIIPAFRKQRVQSLFFSAAQLEGHRGF